MQFVIFFGILLILFLVLALAYLYENGYLETILEEYGQ